MCPQLLIDCVPLQLESWRSILMAAGHAFTQLDLQPFSGMDGMWMLDQLLPGESAETKQRLLKAQGESYRRDFLARAPAFPGVRKLFQALRKNNVLVGIATTCQKDELAAYDQKLGILELTDVVSCGEMVKHGKPDPSLFNVCLDRLQIGDASRALAIGDTPYDARAAKALGMQSAGVITGGFSAQELRLAGCDSVFEKVQLVGSVWESPSMPLVRSSS